MHAGKAAQKQGAKCDSDRKHDPIRGAPDPRPRPAVPQPPGPAHPAPAPAPRSTASRASHPAHPAAGGGNPGTDHHDQGIPTAIKPARRGQSAGRPQVPSSPEPSLSGAPSAAANATMHAHQGPASLHHPTGERRPGLRPPYDATLVESLASWNRAQRSSSPGRAVTTVMP